MTAKLLMAVAAGGALGAVGRYALMSGLGPWLGAGAPYATLVVNVLGAFALGALVEVMALVWSPGEAVRAFLVVGVLGGFTTFSAFALDVVYLVERGMVGAAGLYVLLSVGLGVAAFFAGLVLLRQVLG